ncbi:MAG: hypothetical protein ACOY15_00825, partial [Pseudomonadota bacterium]
APAAYRGTRGASHHACTLPPIHPGSSLLRTSGAGNSIHTVSFAISDENYNAVAPLISDGVWFV